MDENVIRRRFPRQLSMAFALPLLRTPLRQPAPPKKWVIRARIGRLHFTNLPGGECPRNVRAKVRVTGEIRRHFAGQAWETRRQLMVESAAEREKARVGYELIRQNTRNQFALAWHAEGCRKVPNDIETPHLWSDNFLFAYDGLSRVPWDLLGGTSLGRPCVLHEYGNWGVASMRIRKRSTHTRGFCRILPARRAWRCANTACWNRKSASLTIPGGSAGRSPGLSWRKRAGRTA